MSIPLESAEVHEQCCWHRQHLTDLSPSQIVERPPSDSAYHEVSSRRGQPRRLGPLRVAEPFLSSYEHGCCYERVPESQSSCWEEGEEREREGEGALGVPLDEAS